MFQKFLTSILNHLISTLILASILLAIILKFDKHLCIQTNHTIPTTLSYIKDKESCNPTIAFQQLSLISRIRRVVTQPYYSYNSLLYQG